jgi:Arm DNA-binding domain
MGSKWLTGGVSAAPQDRIQFDFKFEGVRYRPTIRRPPSEANLRRARERLHVIKTPDRSLCKQSLFKDIAESLAGIERLRSFPVQFPVGRIISSISR